VKYSINKGVDHKKKRRLYATNKLYRKKKNELPGAGLQRNIHPPALPWAS